MIISRIGRSLSRSSASKNLIGRNGRSAIGAAGSDSYLGRVDGELGFMRSYVAAAIGVHKTHVAEVGSVFGNPRLLRLFSSEAPKKKNYENFYPKKKKEIPKGDEQKSESKDGSSTEEQGSFQETIVMDTGEEATIVQDIETREVYQEFKKILCRLISAQWVWSTVIINPTNRVRTRHYHIHHITCHMVCLRVIVHGQIQMLVANDQFTTNMVGM